MATEVALELATEAHARALAPELRDGDLEELEAMGVEDPLEHLVQGVRGELALAWVAGDQVAALFGVSAFGLQRDSVLAPSPLGAFWFLTGRLFGLRPIAFLRLAVPSLSLLLRRYPVLLGLVDGRYTGGLRLAAAMGAHFDSPVALGPRGQPFLPFTIRRAAWAD